MNTVENGKKVKKKLVQPTINVTCVLFWRSSKKTFINMDFLDTNAKGTDPALVQFVYNNGQNLLFFFLRKGIKCMQSCTCFKG